MGREIKFRAWSIKNKCMCKWEDIIKECNRLSFLTMPEFEIMQYTGLKDKEGVGIYFADCTQDFVELFKG